jgi:hypothetical protein
MPSDYSPENVAKICEMVAEGKTLRQIQAATGWSMGTLLNWTTKPEHVEQYMHAREAASDIFETDIIEAALSCGPESASSDRVKIDALKWVAARRAPKKYGDRTALDLGGQSDNPIIHASLPPDEAYKLMLNGGKLPE